MDNQKDELTYFDKIGLSGEKIFGYLYAGILAMLCFAIIDLAEFKIFINGIGTLITMLLIIGSGVIIYVIYFRILGDFFLFQLQHLIHVFIDKVFGKTGEKLTCSFSYLGFLGVPPVYRRPAYESIKNDFINPKERKSIQIAHGEIHILYLTFIELFGTYIVTSYLEYEHKLYFLYASLICLALAFFSDTMQHMIETRYIKRRKNEVIEHLKDFGFIN